MESSLLLTGIGLRTPHYSDILQKQPRVAWLEAHSENFFCEGGKPLYFLEKIRTLYPLSLHGVNLSLGSSDELNWQHLKKLKELISFIDPCLVSDHLCWSSINGQYFHDLLPLPFTEEALKHVVARIRQVQDYLNRQILIENITQYIQFNDSTIPEAEFLKEVAVQSNCGILLDISNIYINSTNLGFNPHTFMQAIPKNLIQEIHIAGFSTILIDEKEVLIDSHNRPIVPAVWDLYKSAIQYYGTKPTMIEWDSDIPSLETLCLEAYRAEKILRETHVITKRAG